MIMQIFVVEGHRGLIPINTMWRALLTQTGQCLQKGHSVYSGYIYIYIYIHNTASIGDDVYMVNKGKNNTPSELKVELLTLQWFEHEMLF